MPSQTSNSRLQTHQQSRAVHSSPSFSSSSDPQSRNLASTHNSGAPKKMTPQYFEEYGLRVPFFRLRQKRLHARSASELAIKSKDALFNIAKDIAYSQASKLRKASRSDLAQFIERVETLALGPHPNATLPSIKKEDIIEALGLKATAQKAKCSRAKKEALGRKPAPKKATKPTDGKVIAQSIVSFPTKNNKSGQKPALVQQATPPASSPEEQTALKPVTVRTKTLHDPQVQPGVVQKTNKRKYDSTDAPADAAQTPAKKTRVTSTPPPKPPQMSFTLVTETQVIKATSSAPLVPVEQVSQDRTAVPLTIPSSVPAESPQLHEEQEATNLGPVGDPDPSCVVCNSDHAIIVTHVPLDTYAFLKDPKTGQKRHPPTLESLDGGRTYIEKLREAGSFTSIPRNTLTTSSFSSSTARRIYAEEPLLEADTEQPFLKPGVHGRGGDFENDLDRATGRGHQVAPSDVARRRRYDAMYTAFHHQHPSFPWLGNERRLRISDTVEGLEELRREEVWMLRYREKYPGEVAGHLWDCGCEMIRDGDESEEE